MKAFQSANLTFHPLGRGQKQMVFRENVSYDVYGTFCVESKSKIQSMKLVRYSINTSKKKNAEEKKTILKAQLNCVKG